MAGSLESHFADWNAQGWNVTALTLLLDNPNNSQPPQISAADTWRTQYGINSAYVGIDPSFQMVPGSSVGTPQITIIDPRNMQVALLQEGWGGSYPPQLGQIAQANQ